jgi:hypothetical protein
LPTLGVSWSRDPKGFQHMLKECLASFHSSWLESGGVFHVDIIWSDMLMYVGGMMFGWIITYVFQTGLVVEFEVSLCFAN